MLDGFDLLFQSASLFPNLNSARIVGLCRQGMLQRGQLLVVRHFFRQQGRKQIPAILHAQGPQILGRVRRRHDAMLNWQAHPKHQSDQP